MKNQALKKMFFLLLLAVSQFFISCKKDEVNQTTYSCITCKNTPDAKAEFDNSNKGIYKGVMVGSSGVIVFNLLNTGTAISASLTIDTKSTTLTSSTALVAGQSFSGSFSGVLNGQNVSLNFTVSATGTNPIISLINIPGHQNAIFQLFKETSDNQIIGFEGNTEGVKDSGAKQSGQLNILASLKTNSWIALSTSSTSSNVNIVSGKISGTTYSCDCGPTTTVVGTLTGDQINGTYKGSDNKGTWVAKRTF